ncbi:hypothetical protein GOV11_02820 [Candidatus Woesearchaeota archaeon]|nr:hypothetical protein [Candidatus Woesearchaeota archaeon]
MAKGTRLLARHMQRFGSAVLNIHVKTAGAMYECAVNLFTDDGSFHASVDEWNVLKGTEEALETVHLQIIKRTDKRMTVKA